VPDSVAGTGFRRGQVSVVLKVSGVADVGQTIATVAALIPADLHVVS
jgi:hypothetical protein